VSSADEEAVFEWELPEGLFNADGEMVWEPERWKRDGPHDQERGQTSARTVTGADERATGSDAERSS
jgi:hypothetical protein